VKCFQPFQSSARITCTARSQEISALASTSARERSARKPAFPIRYSPDADAAFRQRARRMGILLRKIYSSTSHKPRETWQGSALLVWLGSFENPLPAAFRVIFGSNFGQGAKSSHSSAAAATYQVLGVVRTYWGRWHTSCRLVSRSKEHAMDWVRERSQPGMA
jgi:hypothetical protein